MIGLQTWSMGTQFHQGDIVIYFSNLYRASVDNMDILPLIPRTITNGFSVNSTELLVDELKDHYKCLENRIVNNRYIWEELE